MRSGTIVEITPGAGQEAVCNLAGYVPAHPLDEGKRRIWSFFESELLEAMKLRKTIVITSCQHHKLKTAIGAHVKEIA